MIPAILHQTWKNRPIPAAFSRHVESWKHFHPQWEFKFWTDASLAGFVDARCPEYANLFHSYRQPISRADLGRYLLLREFGGIYADLDAEALASLQPLLDSDEPLFGYEPPSHAALEFVHNRGFRSIVSNAVILSPAGHPFWDHLLRLVSRCRSAQNPLDGTGPFVLTAAVEQAPAKAAPRVLPAHVFSAIDKFGHLVDRGDSTLKSLAVHHWASTWWKPTSTDAAVQPAPVPTVRGPSMSADEENPFLLGIDGTLLNALASRKGRVLIAVPVRDAANTIEALFECILKLHYPRDNLSMAFLEGDSSDDTLQRLNRFARQHAHSFRRLEVIKHDSGVITPTPRWAPAMQLSRRGNIARVRNELIKRALQDEDWVLWVDADIVKFPHDILTAMLSTGAQIVHPNAVRKPRGESMDLNAWVTERQISVEAMATWIQYGLYQPPISFHRLYLSDLRYRDTVPLNSVGATMLLVNANIHRAGLLFPEHPYRWLIESEAFGAVACELGIFPTGLPNVEVIHAPQ